MPQQVINSAQFLGRVNMQPNSVQSILDVFVVQGLITALDAEKLKHHYRTNRQVEDYLVSNRIVTRDTVNKAYSILLKLPYISLRNLKIPAEILDIIPKSIAEKYAIIAFAKRENTLLVAVARPSALTINFSSGVEKLLQEKHLEIELYITGAEDFSEALKQYVIGRSKDLLLEKGSLPAVYLRNQDIAGSLLGKFPLDFIENFRAVIFYSKEKNNYAIALENPDNSAARGAIDKIAKSNKINFQLFATSKEDIDYAIEIYKKKFLTVEKKSESTPPILKRPIQKDSKEEKPLSKLARSDDDVITFSSLFSSFLGGDRDNRNKRKQPLVTIDQHQIDQNQIDQNKEDNPKPVLDQPIDQKPDTALQKQTDQSQEEEKITPKVPAEPSKEEQNEPDDAEFEIRDDDAMDSAKIGRLLDRDVKTDQDLANILKENYIPKTVAAIINYALHQRASDIHIEPAAKNLRVRVRVDGILRDIAILPLKLHPPIISRIKILSKMKLDETRIPQDGRFDLPFKDREVDVRVSCLPTVHGEKVVMRILDKSQDILSLEDLGMIGRAFDLTIEAIKKPYGIILSTGPTGSGKSTTLYAAISRISSPAVNIVTLEDPVEYEIPGVNQCQVKPAIGFSFADGLRSVLRQDPNVVMVGEIRDSETALMATHAALTGHLVLSTLHTNDAASALPRLTNMGVEPFLITSSIDLVIAQRLVRRICPRCKEESKIPDSLIEEIKDELSTIPKTNQSDLKRAEKPLKFFHGAGCQECNRGYRSRVGVFEVIRMTPEIEELAVARKPANDIKAAAIKDGMITMKQDGILKALEGMTTLDEVFQVSAN